MKAENILKRVKKAVETVFLWASMALILEMAVLLLIQIFCRYVLRSPIFWVEEILRLSQIWVVFLASPLVLERSEHPGFRAIPDLLPLAGKKAVWILSMLLVILVGWWLCFYGIELCATSNFMSANGLPRYWFIIPVAIGGGWTIVVALFKIVEIIRLTPEEVKQWKV